MLTNKFEELSLSGNLPSPAGVGLKILQLTRTDDYDTDEIGTTIKADPSLTGRILKLANTASNAGAQPATTVAEAIMRLGTRTVRDLALAFSLVSERRRTGACRAFDFEEYWSKSLGRAVCAQTLSARTGAGMPQESYICALLGEIGRLALACVHPQQYGDLLESCTTATVQQMLETESRLFRINHGEIANCLLSEWGLPETFSDAVQNYATRERSEGEVTEFTDLTDILEHADTLAAAFVAKDLSNAKWIELGKRLEVLRASLGMEHEEAARFYDGCLREWVSWGDDMDIPTNRKLRFAEIWRNVESARLEGPEEPAPTTAASTTAAPTATGSRQAAAEETTIDKVTVLAIDDEPLSLRLLTKHLKDAGYEVQTATDGKQGLKLALELNPDIVVADWQMPEMDGLELCKALRRTETGQKMFFLLLTGMQEGDRLIEAFDAGVDDFVTKPFLPRLLQARIKGGVRLVRLQRKVEKDKETMRRQVAEMGMLTRKLRSAALTDILTELPNRRYAMKRMESEWASAERTGRPLSLIMLDIDHFKAVNDTYGHDMGDVVLKGTAQILRNSIRQEDEVCRIGGEEFIIVCRNTSKIEGALVAERVRKTVEEHIFDESGFNKGVTVSLGVSERCPGIDSIEQLLKAADNAVYAAKETGRNRICLDADHVEGQKKSA